MILESIFARSLQSQLLLANRQKMRLEINAVCLGWPRYSRAKGSMQLIALARDVSYFFLGAEAPRLPTAPDMEGPIGVNTGANAPAKRLGALSWADGRRSGMPSVGQCRASY